jgi:hypothetical protein
MLAAGVVHGAQPAQGARRGREVHERHDGDVRVSEVCGERRHRRMHQPALGYEEHQFGDVVYKKVGGNDGPTR